MTLTNNVAAKFAVAFVAVAMMFSAIAPVAKAQSVSDMSLEELIAMVTALQSQLGQSGSTSGSTGTSYTFTRDLTLGATGADVTALQNWLISQGQTIPAGATGYFGAQTQAALAAWQASKGISPAVGYFGPITRAAVAAVSPVIVDEDEDEEDEDDEDDNVSLSGEASLDAFEVDDMSDDEAEEGETSEVGTFIVEFTDGDAEISRLDIALLAVGSANTNAVQPWRAFETVSLWVDGDMVAEINADDEDDYLDEDTGTLRFTGLDIVAMEDEELEITVGVTVQNGLDAAELTNWNLYALTMRYFDADGVATTEDGVEDLDSTPDASKSAVFETVEEGANDEATIENSNDDPVASTLKVEDDNDESADFDIFVFEIELDEDSGDLELDDMIVDLLVSNPLGGLTTNVNEVIEEVTLTINGQSEDGDGAADSLTPVDGLTHNILATESNRIAYTFEFDGLELDGDDTYEAVLTVVFKGQDQAGTPNYTNGVTVRAFVDGAQAQLEGSEGSNVLTGTEQSETHTLATVVPIVTGVDSMISQANNVSNSGSIIFEFKVEADGDDVDVTVALLNAATALTSSAATPLVKPTPSLAKISGDATGGPANFVVEDGDDATFRLTYTFTTIDADSNGNYTINLDNVSGIEVDETSPALPLAN